MYRRVCVCLCMSDNVCVSVLKIVETLLLMISPVYSHFKCLFLHIPNILTTCYLVGIKEIF